MAKLMRYKGSFFAGSQRTSVKLARASKKMWPKMGSVFKKR